MLSSHLCSTTLIIQGVICLLLILIQSKCVDALIWNAKSRDKNFCIINKNGCSASQRGLSAIYFVSVVIGSKTN